MFAVVSRHVAQSYFLVSIITADEALKADVWLHTEHEGDDTVELQNIPTMMFTMETILRFNAFSWVKANIRAVRLRASTWRYGEARMLPPTQWIKFGHQLAILLLNNCAYIKPDT